MPEIKLGDHVRDKITGFAGVVTAVCDYVTGCRQLLLAPLLSETGEYRKPMWFDIDRLEILEGGHETVAIGEQTRPGPDLQAPAK